MTDPDSIGLIVEEMRHMGGERVAGVDLKLLEWADRLDALAPAADPKAEAQALKGFEHHWDYFGIGGSYHASKAVWMDALRSIGAIKGE